MDHLQEKMSLYRQALEWDVHTWRHALDCWQDAIEKLAPPLNFGLETGARNGGLSWYFASQYQSFMTCSDLKEPSETALTFHRNSGFADRITYRQADVLQLPFPDNHFDFVVFKSLLGALGHPKGVTDKQEMALREMYRVLKPGGLLFFAENLHGSKLHSLARRLFVPWGNRWRYLTMNDLKRYLTLFRNVELHSAGFFNAFITSPDSLQVLVSKIDQALKFLPAHWRYAGFGYAVK